MSYVVLNTYERMTIISTLLTAILQLWVDLPVLLGYLKGQSFPQPFTKEEEAECLERYLNGDESAKMELIERNMRLVAHVVKKFHPKHEQLDDYISIGTIGLMKAVASFTPQKKTRLATYAARCIENEILMHLRSQKKVQKDVSLFETIGSDKDGNPLEIADFLQSDAPSTEQQIERLEEEQKLYEHLDLLDERELSIIQQRYGLGQQEAKTQKEIAKMMNISRSYVSRIETKAIRKLAKEIIE